MKMTNNEIQDLINEFSINQIPQIRQEDPFFYEVRRKLHTNFGEELNIGLWLKLDTRLWGDFPLKYNLYYDLHST